MTSERREFKPFGKALDIGRTPPASCNYWTFRVHKTLLFLTREDREVPTCPLTHQATWKIGQPLQGTIRPAATIRLRLGGCSALRIVCNFPNEVISVRCWYQVNYSFRDDRMKTVRPACVSQTLDHSAIDLTNQLNWLLDDQSDLRNMSRGI